MSDISIPGVPGSSKYNTDKLIQDLMEVERVPLTRMEADRERLELQRSAWQSVNRNLVRLRETSKSLYSFENPFNERIAASTDETVLTATADRTAQENTSEITVRNVASSDRFLSKSVERDYKVPAGTFRFAVGEQEVGFTFRGGSLQSLVRSINERAGSLLRARVVNDTPDTQVLLIEGGETGSHSTMRFLEDSVDFALDIGIIKPTDDSYRSIDARRTSVNSLTNPINEKYVRFTESGAVLAPESALTIPLAPGVQSKANLVLDITYTVTQIPYEYTPPESPPGPSIPESSSISFRGISIANEPSRVLVPKWEPPVPPVKRDDLNVFFIDTGSEEKRLPSIRDAEGEQTLRVQLTEYADFISRINVRNNNTHRSISVNSIKVFDPSTRGAFVPTRPIETAGDASLLLDGIEVTRGTNEIDDLIPGVTLNLHRRGDEPVSLSVEPNRDAAKEAIIEFVGLYNRMLADINILTGRSEEMVNEISYYTDDEREKATEQLGLFQGDISLRQLKTRSQTIMMNPYPTSAGRELTLMDQIGISTNPTRTGGVGVDRSRLRGYLDIDEKKLDAALAGTMGAVKELFGRDTDGDLLVDSGVAFTFDSYVKPYVETGGFISYRLDTIGGQISDTGEDIEDFQKKLARVEQDYRRKYGAMEGALNSLEQSSQQINNFTQSLRNE